MAAADARRLHPAARGQVGRAERDALHARARAGDLLDVGHAAGRLEDRVHQQRLRQAGARLELGQQPVDVVDVLRALDLRHHDHVELVADLGDERDQVVEHPRRVQAVDPGPQLRLPEVVRLGDRRRARRARPPCGRRGRRPRGCRAGRRPSSRCPAPSPPSSRCPGRRSGSSGTASPGSPARGAGAPRASGAKKSFGERIGPPRRRLSDWWVTLVRGARHRCGASHRRVGDGGQPQLSAPRPLWIFPGLRRTG